MLRPIVTALLLLAFGGMSAQQLDLSTLYRYNWQILNPAAVNHIYLETKNKRYAFNAAYRQQWIGFEGAPATYNARFEYFPKETSTKLGFFAMGDQAGAIGTNSIYGNYAYLLFFDKNPLAENYLSIGVNVGAVWYRVNMDEIRFQEAQPDLAVEGILNQSYADMALGVFYRWQTYDPSVLPEKIFTEFYAGLSVPQTFTLNLGSPQEGGFELDRVQHFYLITGSVLKLSRKLLLEPSLWVRYVPDNSFQTLLQNAPLSADLNLRVQYNNRMWGGFGAGTNRLLHFEGGYMLGQGLFGEEDNYSVTIGFAVDMPVGWSNWLGPSAELSVGIGWD